MKNAFTSNSHFGKGESKPVCLIVDEVDGAVSGGINAGFGKVAEFLKKCINKTQNSKATNVENDEKEMSDDENDNEAGKVKVSKSKKNDNSFELRRPIIFVCNDLYAKAIKPLRDLSLQVKIPEADAQRLK